MLAVSPFRFTHSAGFSRSASACGFDGSVAIRAPPFRYEYRQYQKTICPTTTAAIATAVIRNAQPSSAVKRSTRRRVRPSPPW